MKTIRLLIVCCLIISTFSGCGVNGSKVKNSTVSTNSFVSNNQKDNTSTQINETKETLPDINNKKITIEDFNINYKNIIINDKIPFRQIADKLGIILGKNEGNSNIRAGSNVENVLYSWYVVNYPSKEKEEMRIEYVMNETMNTEYLVAVELFN